MKKILIVSISACSIFIFSCSKTGYAPEQPIRDIDSTSVSLQLHGAFENGPYGTVTGNGKVFEDSTGKYNLVLDSFTTSNGPDLHVYLSQEVQPIHFIDLGKLKSTSGTQVYNIIGKPDFSLYKYALIHCQEYNHLFGSCPLQ